MCSLLLYNSHTHTRNHWMQYFARLIFFGYGSQFVLYYDAHLLVPTLFRSIHYTCFCFSLHSTLCLMQCFFVSTSTFLTHCRYAVVVSSPKTSAFISQHFKNGHWKRGLCFIRSCVVYRISNPFKITISKNFVWFHRLNLKYTLHKLFWQTNFIGNERLKFAF